MGKSSSSPDYSGMAQAEAAASAELTEATTWANRPNQYTPWGQITWQNQPVYDPTTNQYINQWNQYEMLNPQIQSALDQQLGLLSGRSDLAGGMMNQVAYNLGTPMDWSQFGSMSGVAPLSMMQGGQIQTGYNQAGLPIGYNQYAQPMGYDQEAMNRQYSQVGLPTDYQQRNLPEGYEQTGLPTQYNQQGLPISYDQQGLPTSYSQEGLQTSVGDPTQTWSRSEESLYNRMTSRLDPQFEGELEQLEIKLRGRGLGPGDQAYDAEMSNFNQRKTDAYQGAMNEAITQGGADASRMFGMQLQGGQFANEAQQQMNTNRMLQAGFSADQIQQMNENQMKQAGFSADQIQTMNENVQRQASFQAEQTQQMNTNRMLQAGYTADQIQTMNENQMQQAGFSADQIQQMNENVQRQATFYSEQAQQDNENKMLQAGYTSDQISKMNESEMQQAVFQAEQTQIMNQNAQQQAEFFNQAQNMGFSQQEASMIYNQNALFRQADYANQLRQQAIQEQMMGRTLSLNEMNALLSGQQVQSPQYQGFMGAGTGATPQLMQAGMAQGNYDQMQQQGMMQGLGTLATAAAMYWSDRRLKKNIRQIGTLRGYPFYEFDFVWGEAGKGVMSDEVNPDAVVRHSSGFDMVDYSKL